MVLFFLTQVFDSIANFGSNSSIDKAKTVLLEHIEGDLKVYTALNEGRNPLAGLETYVIGMLGSVLTYFFSHAHTYSQIIYVYPPQLYYSHFARIVLLHC